MPPRDVGAYADALARLSADPALRRRMGAAGHARVADYRWEVVNEAVLSAYAEVMAGRAA